MRRRRFGDMIRIEAAIAREHCPQDPRVLVGQRHHGFCKQTRSFNCTSHWLMRPLRQPAIVTADFAPCISGMHK